MKIRVTALLSIILAAGLLTSVFFMTTTSSSPSVGGYDPWVDLNDDGKIDYKDLFMLARAYGTSGTPINKTALLLELQTRIDMLNSTLSNIPRNNETYSTTLADISGYSALFWQNMSDMSVEITLATKSTLLIMFSAQARVSGTMRAMYVRAMVDATQANPPTAVILTESDEWASHSYTFYSPNVAAGTHTINIQWKLYDELSTGQVKERTLTVIALPA